MPQADCQNPFTVISMRVIPKREAVNLALRTLANEPMSLEEARAKRGSGWEGAKVSAAGLKAMATEQSAEAAVNQAHTAMALANSAAKSAADAKGAARQVSLALGAVLDILDADEGVTT